MQALPPPFFCPCHCSFFPTRRTTTECEGALQNFAFSWGTRGGPRTFGKTVNLEGYFVTVEKKLGKHVYNAVRWGSRCECHLLHSACIFLVVRVALLPSCPAFRCCAVWTMAHKFLRSHSPRCRNTHSLPGHTVSHAAQAKHHATTYQSAV